MTHVLQFDRTGGPEVLVWREVPDPVPGPGQVLVRHSAIGLNYIDIYHRSGVYPVPQLPSGLGYEAAGTVAAVGDGVDGLKVGDRVAYAAGPLGAYAESRVIAAERAIFLPGGVEEETAAAFLFKALTAQFLLRRVYPVKAGDVVLIHAAAGGVGLLLCQWAKHLGATVIGTVGDEAKADLARRNGCDHTILYRTEPFDERVAALTGGAKAHVVYDSVGNDTFLRSLDCLRTFGTLVSFGVASGDAPLLDVRLLLAKGSLFVTRPSFGHYTRDIGDYRSGVAEVLELMAAGVLNTAVNARYPLRDAVRAQADMEARKTTGASLLIP